MVRRILISLIIISVFLFNSLAASAESAGSGVVINTSRLESGVVGISYSSNVDKLKVIIEKDGVRYTYNLNNNGIEEYFSLQLGNGSYKVSVYENIGGSKYRKVASKNVSLYLSDSNRVYLASVQNINWNNEDEAVKKAAELVRNVKGTKEKIRAIYEYIVSNIEYDYGKLERLPNTYFPDIDETMSSKKGICYDFSSLFAAMLRSQGIPAKLVKGYAVNVEGYHAWNEVYDEEAGKWLIVDTTYDSQMRKANKKYNMEKPESQYTKDYEY